MLPMKEDNDNEDSEVNYEDPEEANKENHPPRPPPGFMNNNPDHPFYHIYVRNTLYRANEGDWTHKRLIIAPFIKYSTNYTHVEGSAGVGTETHSCPVQIDRRVPSHAPMTTVKWRHLRNGNEKEFTINMALAQINDPSTMGKLTVLGA